MSENLASHSKKRYTFVLRLWEHGRNKPLWIGEIRDIVTGETLHVHDLDGLFEWIRQKTNQISTPTHHENGD